MYLNINNYNVMHTKNNWCDNKNQEETKMTKERIQAIAEALENDELRRALLAMEPAVAAEELKKEGYDFTADELIEFGTLVASATSTGELNAEDLDAVAGGAVTVVTLLGVTFATKVAYDLGKAVASRKW